MSALAEQRLTVAAYLDIERCAETKSEFFAGRMFAMAGANRAHVLIAANLTGELRLRLRETECRVYSSDLRVKVDPTGLYTYPDVVVVCGEERYEDTFLDTLLNPVLIVEVLSPSTERYDRGEKFAHYRRLESLREYLVVSQDRVRVERFTRQGDEREWLFTEISDSADSVHLACVGCSLPLAEVYAKVEFPAGNEEARSNEP